jgi:hypothetical protein
MTEAYVRVQRNDEWLSIEIDQLTNEELDALAEAQPKDGWKWAKFLAGWIRDNTFVEK